MIVCLPKQADTEVSLVVKGPLSPDMYIQARRWADLAEGDLVGTSSSSRQPCPIDRMWLGG